jgi:hypothetical protein
MGEMLSLRESGEKNPPGGRKTILSLPDDRDGVSDFLVMCLVSFRGERKRVGGGWKEGFRFLFLRSEVTCSITHKKYELFRAVCHRSTRNNLNSYRLVASRKDAKPKIVFKLFLMASRLGYHFPSCERVFAATELSS